MLNSARRTQWDSLAQPLLKTKVPTDAEGGGLQVVKMVPAVVILRRLSQEEHEFGASKGYIARSRPTWTTEQDSVFKKKKGCV